MTLAQIALAVVVYSISVARHLDLQYAPALAGSALQLYVLRESSGIFANPLRRQSAPALSAGCGTPLPVRGESRCMFA